MIRLRGCGNRGSEDWGDCNCGSTEGFHRKVDLEHVENWDSRHSLQPRTPHLASPHHRGSHHDLANQHKLAVHHEKRTLVHFACEVSLLSHRVCSDVNLIVGETFRTVTRSNNIDTR